MTKAAPSKEVSVDEVEVNVQRKPACRIELEVKASPTLVLAARKEAIKKVGKEVSFPGFRKGKAPEAMILKQHPGTVESEWHKSIANAAFAAAQSKAKVSVLNNGIPVTFDLKKHSLEDGAELVFSFETDPVLPSIDPTLFQPNFPKKAEVGEKEIEEAIRQMRYFYAEWKQVESRGIQQGDTIQIDLETFDGETPQKVFDQVRFEVSEERMAQWMKNLVLGAKAGDVLEGMSEADVSATEEEKKEFTPKKVRLTIHRAEEATLPELNDEFAKKVGSESCEQLRESVQSILEKNAQDKVQSQLREQVNEFLIREYAFELPLSLIDTERNHRKEQLLRDPHQAAQHEKLSEEEKNQFNEKLYEESSQAVRLFYLSRHVVKEAGLTVTHGDVQQEAVQSALARGQKVDPGNLPKELYALALSKVILSKAQDHILANCKKEEEPATPAPEKEQ